MEEINTSMNIETAIFKKYKEYIKDKSKFNPNVFNDAPKNLAVFPTITLIETNNAQDLGSTTLDRTESSNNLTYTIEIYSKDMVINGVTHSSKEIINEIKYLTFDFFEMWGFIRTQSMKVDYLNYEVSRYVITETCSVNNWNRKLNL